MDEALISHPIGSIVKPVAPAKAARQDPPKTAEPAAAGPGPVPVPSPTARVDLMEKRGSSVEITIEHGVLLMAAVALTLALCFYKGHLKSGDRDA